MRLNKVYRQRGHWLQSMLLSTLLLLVIGLCDFSTTQHTYRENETPPTNRATLPSPTPAPFDLHHAPVKQVKSWFNPIKTLWESQNSTTQLLLGTAFICSALGGGYYIYRRAMPSNSSTIKPKSSITKSKDSTAIWLKQTIKEDQEPNSKGKVNLCNMLTSLLCSLSQEKGEAFLHTICETAIQTSKHRLTWCLIIAQTLEQFHPEKHILPFDCSAIFQLVYRGYRDDARLLRSLARHSRSIAVAIEPTELSHPDPVSNALHALQAKRIKASTKYETTLQNMFSTNTGIIDKWYKKEEDWSTKD